MSPDQQLLELLQHWEEGRAEGREIAPEELCAACPERLVDLRAAIATLEQVNAGRQQQERPAEPSTIEPAAGAGADSPGYRAGTRLGRFVIGRELGQGTFGIVYLAHDPQLRRTVALKIPRSHVLADPQARARFQREALAAAGLDHPNLVSVYEAGEADGTCYIAEAYCPGMNLAAWLKQRPELVPYDRAAALVATLADAVQQAHDRGVIHRDLKPSNVLLMFGDPPAGSPQQKEEAEGDLRNAVPKITDFGLAKILAGGVDVAGVGKSTASGAIVGTPSYMAPEQAGGRTREVGPATDVYALGAILYELLTGRPPFNADTQLEILLLVQAEEPVSVTRLQPKVPRDLETICLKCLEKEPLKRYASARELSADLRRFLANEPIKARPVGRAERLWRWARRNPALAGLSTAVLVLLLTAAVGATAAAVRIAAARDEARDRAREAEEAKEREAQEHRQAVEKLVRLYVNTGMRLAGEEGDSLGALPWLVEAFRLEPGGPEREIMHRFRLASVLERCPRLIQVWFNPAPVNSAEYSPDGRRVVTAASDGFARVWDLATGQTAIPPLRHAQEVTHATFSPDSRRVATSSRDGTARVWDAATGQEVAVPLRHGSCVNWVAFSSDGRRVLTASADGTARVWDAATGQAVTPPLPHTCQVVHAAFSPDGRRVVTACGKGGSHHLSGWRANALPKMAQLLSEERRFGHARVWDAETGKPLTPFLKDLWDSTDQVRYACFSPDSRLVLTSHAHNFAQVWDAATGKRAGPTLYHDGWVQYASFSPDGRRLVTACGNWVRLWDAVTGRLLVPPLKHDGAVSHASFSPDGHYILTAGDDELVHLWDAATGEPVGTPLRSCIFHPSFSPDGRQVLAFYSHIVRVWEIVPNAPGHRLLPHRWSTPHAAFSPDGGRVVTASNDKTARVWDAATGRAISPTLQHAHEVVRAAFRPDGRVVTVDRDGTAQVWDAVTGERVAPPLPLGRKVTQASFDRDARQVATVGTDTAAGVWDLATGRYVALRGQDGVLSASFSPDGRLLVTAGNDKTARLWDAATGRPLASPLKHDDIVCHAAFSPDGRLLVTAGNDKTARLWDAATGRAISPPLWHARPVTQAAFSPDGRRVVTASMDRTARVWDTATGQPLAPPLVHLGRVAEATFSPDSRRVATASWDGTTRVWDAATGEAVSAPLKHKTGPLHVTFSPDGRQLLTSGWDWEARLWDLPYEDRGPEDLLPVTEFLSGYRIDATGGLALIREKALHEHWWLLRAKYPKGFASIARPSAGKPGRD
jgi:WD40 repeat protein